MSATGPRWGMTERRRKILGAALIFLLPNFLGFLIFTLGPVLYSLVMSFTDWNLARHTEGGVPISFTGTKNLTDMLGFLPRPMAPETASPSLWLVGLFVAAVGLCFLAYLVWRLRTPIELGEGNPRGRFYLGLLLIGLTTNGVLQSLQDGTWDKQHQLGIGWFVLQLLFVALLAAFCARYLVTNFTGRDLKRVVQQAVALLLLVVGLKVTVMLGEKAMVYWAPSTPRFWLFLYNTLYLMLGLPLGIAGSLLMALILHRTVEVSGWSKRFTLSGATLGTGLFLMFLGWLLGCSADALGFIGVLTAASMVGVLFGTTGFRTIFYLPSLSMGVATFVLWQKMYNVETGPINTFLAYLFDTPVANGLERVIGWWQGVDNFAFTPPEWLKHPDWAKPALIFMGVWGAIGSNTMLLYLAALSNVPGELYEAADVDGASKWQRFWSVTWPQLAPTTFFVVIMGCIGGLQGGFEQARVMTKGGPADSTTTLSYYLYNQAFEANEMGYGCAVAWVLFGMVFVLTMINWRFGSQMVNYE